MDKDRILRSKENHKKRLARFKKSSDRSVRYLCASKSKRISWMTNIMKMIFSTTNHKKMLSTIRKSKRTG
jgi:hypothetical protein